MAFSQMTLTFLIFFSMLVHHGIKEQWSTSTAVLLVTMTTKPRISQALGFGSQDPRAGDAAPYFEVASRYPLGKP